MSIEELVNEFEDYAHISAAKLGEILATVSEGKVPEETDCIELNDAITQLRCKYESISKLAAIELLEDEVPEEGSSVAVYYEAFKNSKSTALKK